MSRDDDGILSPPPSASEEMAGRREANSDVEATLFEGVRTSDGSPVEPVKLTLDDAFKFRCHKGVSCWNACCHGADVTLSPYDILTLAKHFSVRPSQFIADFTLPALHEGSGLPVTKLVMTEKDGKGPCVFMHEENGCSVYDARPATCRYYPLGLGAYKLKGHEEREDMHFLVKEAHCEGHKEEQQQTVGEFRSDQGIEPYDLLNQRWIDILMKMTSWKTMGGPMGKDVSTQTKKMFYMVSTDIDAFRRFVFETKFLETYDIDDDMIEAVRTKDEALLQLGFDWLKNVMFNEETLSLREPVLQQAIAAARDEMGGS